MQHKYSFFLPFFSLCQSSSVPCPSTVEVWQLKHREEQEQRVHLLTRNNYYLTYPQNAHFKSILKESFTYLWAESFQ